MKRMMMMVFAVVVCVAIAAEVSAAEVWSDCTPTAVASYGNRVHVKCSASVSGGIFYFALATTDTAQAARFVSVASSALVAGRNLKVLYDPADLTGAQFGCATNDCRRARALELR